MRSTQKRKLFLSALITVFLAAGLLLGSCGGEKTKTEALKTPAVITSEKLPKMVDFWSPTCPPCRAMMPMLEELHTEYDHAFELVKIDVSKQENQAISIQNQIQYIPTQIFYDENGKQLFRHTGYFSKDQILSKWKELGYEMTAK